MNPLLEKVSQALLAKVAPENRNTVQKIVLAGEKVMHSPQTHQMMTAQLSKPGDPAQNAGEGVAKLMGLLFKESKGTMQMKTAVPASQLLLFEGLDFMEQTGKIKVSNELIASASKALSGYFLQLFGVTPEKLAQLKQKAQSAGTPPITSSAPPPPQGLIAAVQGAR